MRMSILSLYVQEVFFQRITLPTRIQLPSFSLIDNILTNEIDKITDSISGLLTNDLSDHEIILTFLNDKSYLIKVDKFIDIKKRDERSMNNFINELKALNMYDQLDKELTGDPNENHQLLSSRLNAAMEKNTCIERELSIKKSFTRNQNGLQIEF